MLDLPFAADRFDVVVCESVLAFVEDKRRAIRECLRVTRPGGYVGLNKMFWIDEASPAHAARARAVLGRDLPAAAAWQALWEESGLQDLVVRIRQVDLRQELKDRHPVVYQITESPGSISDPTRSIL